MTVHTLPTDRLSVNFFAAIDEKVRSLQANGSDIIRLDIGSPDMMPAPHIVAALQQTANAENSHSMDKDALVITRILVDDGIKFRRYRAVARGRGHGYVKRRAHILIELTEKK